MQSKRTKQLSALILSACLAGLTQQAQAQDPTTTPPGAEELPQMAPQPEPQTAPGAQLESESPAPPVAAPTVPTYEPVDYQLTPPGSSAVSARSEVRRWPNRPLLGTSALMFTGAYVPSVLFAKYNDDTTDNLYIPVAGPWMELANEPASSGNKALLAVSGVFQGLGALGMLTSLFVPERRTSQWYLIGNKRLSAAPVANQYTYGVSARGQF
jgi:hypothetical protein